MVSLYRRQYSTFQVSPFLEDETPLLDFYVMPDILSVTVERGRGSVREVKTLISSFYSVFFNKNKMCNEIYLTADAGLGKTAFSKRLALAWCHTKKPLRHEKKYFAREEIEAIRRFRFVFLLLLRDSSSACDIDDLIIKQIISQLPYTDYTLNDLEDILAKETCLVILDGLDEWSHPSNICNQRCSAIPHRKARECTVVLTTTRPWKLRGIGLRPSQIEQKLEIKGLNPESTNTLKRSVLSHLFETNDECQIQKYVTELTKTVKDKHMSDLESIPLLLTYLIYLWFNKIELGQSQCDLYCNIVELLLSRTVQSDEKSSTDQQTEDDVPECFSELENCRRFYPRLICLGKLAFQTLSSETSETNMLVFDSSVAEKYLDEQFLRFFLRTGIITQTKVLGTLLGQISKVSFAQKTMQEFFASLYIRSSDETSVSESVLSKCKCVKDILKMSNILIFLSGLNDSESSSISRDMMTILDEDDITNLYRRSLLNSEPLKQFQDMSVLCCKELPHENEVNVCLQDVFIDESCQQKQFCDYLKKLIAKNKQSIRSLYIDMLSASFSSAQEVVEYFALSDLENIEKILFNGEYNDRDILPLLKSSVTTLSLLSYSSWSVLLNEKVTSLQKLEAIHIEQFEMSHELLTLLYDYISQRKCMREVRMQYLRCSDHDRNSCTGCCLDLSQHYQLMDLRLLHIPVSELNINMSSLVLCFLQNLSNPYLVLRCTHCDLAELDSFVCDSLESSAAMETIQQTLPLLVHVKNVKLLGINFVNTGLLSSEMLNIEHVAMCFVTMPASVLRGIVTVLQQLPQTVTVDIHHCNITPESEFVTVKKEIKQSSKFRVSGHSKAWTGKTFKFETIKDGD